MNEDYSDKPFTFQDAVNAITFHSIACDFAMPSWIRDDSPGEWRLVLSWTTAQDMREWFTYFNVRQHRADPPVWAWGWHGWTVQLTVLESGAGAATSSPASVSVTDTQAEARGAALAAVFSAPDATIELPAVTL